jgi:flagellar basal body rod protein FlgB
MSELGFSMVEQGMRIAQERALVLAADAANARTPGYVARDVVPAVEETASGLRFSGAVRQAQSPGAGHMIEFAMGATAQNSVRFRALADQERAMLHEFRLVAEEARR